MAIAGFRPNGLRILLIVALGMSLAMCPAHANDAANSPVNLAKKARLTASNEYGANYLARFAVDGKVPDALCGQDRQAAWVVRGKQNNFQGLLTFV